MPPTVFIPQPKVDSALVRILRHDAPPVTDVEPDRMFTLVRAGFAQRRNCRRYQLIGEPLGRGYPN